MEYKENALQYEDYCRLRESVEWRLFSKEQMKNAVDNSVYTVTAVDGDQTVGMGRLTGDADRWAFQYTVDRGKRKRSIL